MRLASTVGGQSGPDASPVPSGAELAIAAVALVVPVLLMFHGVLFGGEAFVGRDTVPFFYPMKAFTARSVKAGVLPLWNPWIANGVPFFATLQPGVLYPGSLVLYLLPLPFAFGLLQALHFPLAGLGTYVLLRRWRVRHGAALVGGMAFMLGGYFVSIGNYPNNLQTVAWIPWMWWAWEWCLSEDELRGLLLLALLTAVAFLGGEPEMVAVGAGLLLVHGLLRVEGGGVSRVRQLAAFSGAMLLAAALVGVQLIPFGELVGHSVRTPALGMEFGAHAALEPVGLAGLLVPPALDAGPFDFTTRLLTSRSTPWLLSIYPGAVVLALACGLGGRPRDRRRLLFWGAASVVGLIIALGPATPVFPFLFRRIPLLRIVRYPEKLMVLPAMAIAALAAFGTDAVLGGSRGARWRVLAAGGVLLTICTGALLIGALRADSLGSLCGGPLAGLRLCEAPAEAARAYGRILARSALLLALLLVVVLAFRRGSASPRAVAWVLIVLVAADLVAAHQRINPSVDADVYRSPPWAARALDRLDPKVQTYRYRGSSTLASMGSAVMLPGASELSNLYLNIQTLAPNMGMVWPHLSQDGVQGVALTSVAFSVYLATHSEPAARARLLRLSNVRYYADATATADSLPGLVPVASNAEMPIRIYRVENTLARAYVVSRDTIVSEPLSALRAALAPRFPFRRSVVLDRRPTVPPAAGGEGEVLHADWGTNEVGLTVRADSAALLVLTDRWYPGWHATVNGRSVDILRANGYFRAVSIPAGRSRVEFRFEPESVRIGGWISVAGILIWVMLALLSARWNSRAGAPVPPRGGRDSRSVPLERASG